MAEVNYRSAGDRINDPAITPSQKKAIYFASIVTLIATGVGFAVRGAILDEWGSQFGFTKTDLGYITGGGLTGFGITIIVFSFFADLIGFKKLLIGAFFVHLLSAVVTLAATPVFHAFGKNAAYYCLFGGSFIFSLGNGMCEASINPLTATLFPKNKTHYLNILHAGWPIGLVLGSLLCVFFKGMVRWEVLMAIYMLPVFYYGIVVVRNPFPVSEAAAAGVKISETLVTLVAPLLIFLWIIHAMIGYVELGTDSWVQNIMNNVIGKGALLLFVYISLLMSILRFTAGPIVHKINPLGLLFLAACCGAIGLYMLGTFTTLTMIIVAGTIFALGKTFYWPTMLGVIGERFPKGGALAMGISGGIGMLSAGLLGAPGIGYTQDRQASAILVAESPSAYARVKASDEGSFLFFKKITGLDGSKVAAIKDGGKQLAADAAAPANKNDASIQSLNRWFTTDEAPHLAADKAPVSLADTDGGRAALRITAAVPTLMAACYLLLVIYFMSRGGYKAVHLDAGGREIEVTHTAAEEEAIEAAGPYEA